jgi:glycerol kinase
VTGAYVASIDQGSASSRCMLFDRRGRLVSVAQKEHRQLFPRPGWVEQDAEEILGNVLQVVPDALEKAELKLADLVALGIANQRETTVVWDRDSGRPIYNAISWQDTRTDKIVNRLAAEGGKDRFRAKTGLPLTTYFSGPKIQWILDHVEGARDGAERGTVLFGTMDTWLIWKLTGRHVTDVTNASRTMLMDLRSLDWDDELLEAMKVPRAMLPEIHASSEPYGEADSRSPPLWGTSRRRSSARPASQPERPSAPTALGASCSSTPATGWSSPPTGCSQPWDAGSLASRRRTRSRAPSRSPELWCSGCATSWA